MEATAPDPVETRRAVSGTSVRRLLLVVSVVSVIATLLTLLLLQRFAVTYRSGLDTTVDGAKVTAQVAGAASDVAGNVGDLSTTATAGLDSAVTALGSSADGLEQMGTAAQTNLADGLEGTATVANDLAGFVEAVERFIPGNRKSLAEDLRAVADGLGPAPEQLRSVGKQLGVTADQLRATVKTLAPLGPQAVSLAASIADSRTSLDQVQTLATAVLDRSTAARDRADLDLMLARLVVLMVGGGAAVCALLARRMLY